MESLPVKVRIGARPSALAECQAARVAEIIGRAGVSTEIKLIQTAGDLSPHPDFGAMGERGVFVKELEQALLAGEIDLAVHSLKDLPTILPPGLQLAAALERESPLDAWVSRNGSRFNDLPKGARAATGSLRRQAQILALRPDLETVPIRGNVPTRIGKIKQGYADGAMLAVAGLRRLGLEHEIAQIMTPAEITPAMGQGALAVESREDEMPALWPYLDDPIVRVAVDAERLFLSKVGGGCRAPVGIHVRPAEDGGWRIMAMLATPDGHYIIRRSEDLSQSQDPRTEARKLAGEMLAEAPGEILTALNRIEPRLSSERPS